MWCGSCFCSKFLPSRSRQRWQTEASADDRFNDDTDDDDDNNDENDCNDDDDDDENDDD